MSQTATSDIFPITDQEASELHVLGWESGYGWDKEFDWFRTPSMGPAVWVEDDDALMRQWREDLDAIRAKKAAADAKARLEDAAPELLEALKEIWAWCSDMPRESDAEDLDALIDDIQARADGAITKATPPERAKGESQ